MIIKISGDWRSAFGVRRCDCRFSVKVVDADVAASNVLLLFAAAVVIVVVLL